MRKVVAAKLHGITVTESNLNYHGSITLDPDHCELAGILQMEFVEIWNRNSGDRIWGHHTICSKLHADRVCWSTRHLGRAANEGLERKIPAICRQEWS